MTSQNVEHMIAAGVDYKCEFTREVTKLFAKKCPRIQVSAGLTMKRRRRSGGRDSLDMTLHPVLSFICVLEGMPSQQGFHPLKGSEAKLKT